jgi:hypothetical protein
LNELLWTSEALPADDDYADLGADAQGNAYVLSRDPGYASFGVTGIDGDGETMWTSYHDNPGVLEIPLAIAALPGGGVIVAGFTTSDGQGFEADASLSWFGPDGTLMQDFVYDGVEEDDADWLYGVAVGPDGSVVVVGAHSVEGGDQQLWTMKVAM